MSKIDSPVLELLDALDDLDDGIEYIREMVRTIFFDELGNDAEEEEDKQEVPQEEVKPETEEKTEK